MTTFSRRGFLGSVATAAATGAVGVPALLTGGARAAESTLKPRKLPFPPNDDFGNYEPAISADGNSIYFARFADNGTGAGDKRVKGTADLFVTRRVRQDSPWPGNPGDWSAPERLPDTVNSDSTDLEPWISPDDKSLYFQSRRDGGSGSSDIWVSEKGADGEWGKAHPVLAGDINTQYQDHCFFPFDLPGQPTAMNFISVRPREAGKPPTTDLYTTRQVNGVWSPAERYADALLDSIAWKCRFNLVTRDNFTLGIVTVHDFGKFHALLFVHYDPASKRWKGPIVEAPFNDWNVDGGCPTIQANGERVIWSAGYDRGPGPITGGPSGGGGVYDIFWLPTSEIIAYYKGRAGLV